MQIIPTNQVTNRKMHKGYVHAIPDLGIYPRVGILRFMKGNIKIVIQIPFVMVENWCQPSDNQ